MKLVVTMLILLCAFQVNASERGAELFQTCIQCHGENGQGNQEKVAPRIAGQHEWYIYSSLVAFKAKERKNPDMYPFIENLSDADFKELAAHVSQLK